MADFQNSLHLREQTLSSMLSELRTRLGFVAQGAASRSNEEILKSFLRDAVEFVWGSIEHDAEKRVARIRLHKGETLYDFHDDDEDREITPGSVLSMSVADGSNRSPLNRGITEADRAEALAGIPEKWDMQAGQIELYPVPDSSTAYRLCIEYEDDGYRFEQPSDRCPVPSRIVLLFALAQAKAHYHQNDAQSVAAMAQTMLSHYRGRQVGGLHIRRSAGAESGWFVSVGSDGVARGKQY